MVATAGPDELSNEAGCSNSKTKHPPLAEKVYCSLILVPDRTIAIANLRTLIGQHRFEEERLRTILANDPTFKDKLQARFDLEKIVKRREFQSDELERLERGW